MVDIFLVFFTRGFKNAKASAFAHCVANYVECIGNFKHVAVDVDLYYAFKPSGLIFRNIVTDLDALCGLRVWAERVVEVGREFNPGIVYLEECFRFVVVIFHLRFKIDNLFAE